MKNEMPGRRIVYISAAVLAVLLPVLLYVNGIHARYVILSAGICLAMIAMIVLMDRMHQKHTDNLLAQLSELIDNLVNMQDHEVFSEVEDTLLSKLQTQVTKLSGILRTQNETINSEKNEIQALVSDISHQIKTPVSSLNMFAEMLLEDKITSEQKTEYAEVMRSSLNKLTFLTESMIKMSRLESGIIQLDAKEASATDVIMAAIKQAYPKAKQKDIEIMYSEKSKHIVFLDSKWTAEAIFNIIDNAVKYSEEGTYIEIETLDYPSFVCVSIKDSGPGIEESEQSRVFGRFYRGKSSSDKEGVGIGLYLARKIIVDQGGYIKLKSSDSGSIFLVFLPRHN